MKVDLTPAEKIIDRYCQDHGKNLSGAVIPLLQDIQKEYGYVPEDAVNLAAEKLGVFPVDIYGVLTFYTQFHLEPRGQHTIRVCLGTACHVMGAKDLLDRLSALLGIVEGQTTEDGMFSLERVACLGCCGMAPVIAVDDDFYGRCTVGELEGIIEKYRNQDGNEITASSSVDASGEHKGNEGRAQ